MPARNAYTLQKQTLNYINPQYNRHLDSSKFI